MKLPLLISVPHAGLTVPAEVADLCCLTPDEVKEDGDVGAREIYAFSDRVARFVTTDVARAIVDQNRPEDDFSKDGVVKTHTCWDIPVWSEPLGAEQVESLLEQHHRPYHRILARPGDDVILGVDCHTMAATAPPVAPDAGRERPPVCLSNAHGTLPDAWFELLFRCFVESFGDEVRKNDPFRGGYITRQHSTERPWVQVELSRDPTLGHAEKGKRVFAALASFCAQVEV